MRENSRTTALLFAALVGFTALMSGPSRAADPPRLSRSQLRAQLRPVYRELQGDSRFLQLRADLAGRLHDQVVVDRYLLYLPMSPLEMLEIDMHERRYEMIVPRLIADWHTRWIELHQDRARELYGHDYVDTRLTGWPAGPPVGTDSISRDVDVGSNRNVAAGFSTKPEDYQGEIQLAVNPNNPNQIVAAANTWDSIGGTCGDLGNQAVFYSSDGGSTWGYSCPPDDDDYFGLSCADLVFGSDPALSWNDSNEVFLNHMLICFDGTSEFAMVVARSSDGGASWSGQGVIKNSWGTGNLEDKNFYAVDNSPTSPFFGRHYTCWDRNNDEKVAYSTDNGTSWTEVDLPTTTGSGTGSRLDLACELEVEDDGTLHIVYDTLSCTFDCTNEEMFYSRSVDGGVSWSTPVEVRDFNLVGFSGSNCPDAQDERCIGPFGAIGVDSSGGPCDGNLYATYGDFTSGGVNSTDIWVTRSTDGGSSWQTPVKVNDDGLADRVQFHPFLQVDPSNGYVVVAWHDARNDAGNDAVEFFVGRSTDCGLSFEDNIRVSRTSAEFNNSGVSSSNENSSDNALSNPNQYGEYLGLDALGGKAYVAWTDTRHYYPGSSSESQKENVGFALVEWPTVSITAPGDGASFTAGTSISFSGSAFASGDGNLSSDLVWSSSLDGSIGSGSSFSSSSLSVGTHAITALVTDSTGLPGRDFVTIFVNPDVGGCVDCIDWNSTPTVSYSNQDGAGNVEVQDGGQTLHLEDNTWRRTTTTFDITADTVLEFDFRSTSEGELHGIGFDEDDTLTNDLRLFKFFGSQNWGSDIDWPDTYSPLGSTKHYVIPVGEHYTGSSMHLVLMNDFDAGVNNTSWFSNVRVYENVSTCTDCIDWSSTDTVSYSNQDGASNFEVQSGGDTLYLEDNTWRRTTRTFSVTAATVLEFDFRSTSEGEMHGIGFDEDDTLTNDLRLFKFFGSQNWSSDIDWPDTYTALGTTKHYVIPVGEHYTGGSMHLVLMNDFDAGVNNTSWFSNVRVFETGPTNTAPTVTISAPANSSTFLEGESVSFAGSATDTEDGVLTASLSWSSSRDGVIGSGGAFATSGLSTGAHTITASVTDSGLLQGSDAISLTVNPEGGGCVECIDWSVTTTVSYSSQDSAGNVVVEDGGETIHLEDNTWRRTTQTFNVTQFTVLEFDFRSTSEGELHGIGFDEDDTLTNDLRLFKFFGSQNWSSDIDWPDTYGPLGSTKHYVIPVGEHYTGSAMRLVLMNDFDAGANNNSWFSNVRVFEDVPDCSLNIDFEAGTEGWLNSAASTCQTGSFVIGTPTLTSSSGVTIQVGGDHTSGSGNAYFSAVNTSAGTSDVDRGNCIVESPVYPVDEASESSIWYYHGQRDNGDDASGDFFRLEISTNGGTSWSTLVSHGDSRLSAAWTNATRTVDAGSNVMFRLQVSDGTSAGDLIEAGIDDVSICAVD